ncbi:hypothetical protein D3C71_2015560 [compost metagenome]
MAQRPVQAEKQTEKTKKEKTQNTEGNAATEKTSWILNRAPSKTFEALLELK